MGNFYRPEHMGIYNITLKEKVKGRVGNYKTVLYEKSRKPIPLTSEDNG
jgi:hypothetical protein